MARRRSLSAAPAAAPLKVLPNVAQQRGAKISAAGTPGGGPIALDPLMQAVVDEAARRSISPGDLYRLMQPHPPCGRQHIYAIWAGRRTPTTAIYAAILAALGGRVIF